MPGIGELVNLIDIAKMTDPSGKTAKIVEMMNENDDILNYIPFMEGNLKTGNETTQRVGLPTIAWRAMNQGVPKSKGKTAQITDTCGLMEGRYEVDTRIAERNGDKDAHMAVQSKGFIEAMKQEFIEKFIYGDSSIDVKEFAGLEVRFHTKSTDKTKSGYQIIDAGGTGSGNTSMYLCTFGELTGYGIFPMASKAGIQVKQINGGTEIDITDDDGNKYLGYATQFTWDVGLTIEDWRGFSRIANIDVSDLNAGTVNIDRFMIDAYHRVKKRSGRRVFFCSDTVSVALHKLALTRAAGNLTVDNFDGKVILKFLDIPIINVDALLETEAQIV